MEPEQVTELLDLKRVQNRLYAEERLAIEEEISCLDDIIRLKGRLHDAKSEIDSFNLLVQSLTIEDGNNYEAFSEKMDIIISGFKDKMGMEETKYTVDKLNEKYQLEMKLSKFPKAVSEDISYCPVEWGQTYKQTQEYGSSIGIDIPSGQVFVPIEDAEHSGFVFSNNDDPEVYLRPDASSQTISHELFHKGHKNKPDMSETERLIYQEGLAEWFGFKVNEEDGNSKIEGFLYYTNNDIYHDHLMDELESQAPYRLGLMLFNDIESQYGTEKVVEIANKYEGPGLTPLLDLMKPETRKIFDHAFSVVYDKPISDIPQPTSS